jgi:hypothetical protein
VWNNPVTRTESFQRRTQRILDLLTREQSAQVAADAAPVAAESTVVPIPTEDSAATAQ